MNNFKLKIIASISHKLKTPLTYSMSLLEDLLDNSQQLSNKFLSEYILPAHNNNLLLNSYISDLCDYAQIEMKSFVLELADFNL